MSRVPAQFQTSPKAVLIENSNQVQLALRVFIGRVCPCVYVYVCMCVCMCVCDEKISIYI